MKDIPCYNFYRHKYGEELLIDVVELSYAKRFLKKEQIHTLSYYDITLITEGDGYFELNTEKEQIKPGSVIFTRPGEIREWDTKHITGGEALIFEEEFLLTFFNDPCFLMKLSYFSSQRSSFVLHLPESILDRIHYLLKEIRSEIHIIEEKDMHMLRALLYETLILLNRVYLQYAAPENSIMIQNRYINRFITLVNEHYKTSHEVCFYAAELCITPDHLNEVVNAATGITPKRYIQNKLVLEAKRLLHYSNLAVAEIADHLGYESSSYFVRSFRKCTGQTPLNYRKSNR